VKASDRQEGGAHYRELPIQPIEYIYRNGLNWCAGNIVKYATRAGRKDATEQEIRKIIHYAELWLEMLSRTPAAAPGIAPVLGMPADSLEDAHWSPPSPVPDTGTPRGTPQG
jgi:hypothetical protein